MDDATGRPTEERQLALLVSGAIDYAIFVLDPTGHVLTWNAGAERMNGYTRAQIIGRHFSAFYTEEDIARDHPADELRIALHEGRYEEEGWRVRQDGTRFWANIIITPIRDESGTLIGFGKVSRDLTARRRNEEQARAKARDLELANRELSEFRRLVTSVRDYAIFMLDPGGNILSWNAGAQHLKGYSPEEAIGRHFSLFYTPEDRARDHPAHELEIAARDGRYAEEGWRVRKDGGLFWAGVTITAIRQDDGRLTGFAKVTRDLTERKAADEALQDANAGLRAVNAELDRFATIAAHDMSDPLRTITGFAELLERGTASAREARRYAEHIRASSQRLSEMLQGLLVYARAGRSQDDPEPVGLVPAAERVVADLGRLIADRGASVTLDLPPDAAVLANVTDVRLVLQNLISNAVKFADPLAPAVHVRAEAASDAYRVTIVDNGAGVADAFQQRIFDPFQRAHSGPEHPGYGLGLAICQRLVDRHGGAIGVDSVPGDGSRFWFTLPRAGIADDRAGGAATPAATT